MFDLIAQITSTGDLSPSGLAIGSVIGIVVREVFRCLRDAPSTEAERLDLEIHELREDLAIERARCSCGGSAAVATPSVRETIDRTARTIEDTCRHVTEMAEKLPAARSRKSSPRKRKNTETIETAEAPNETPPE